MLNKPIGKLPDYIKVRTATDGLNIETRITDVMGVSMTTYYMKHDDAITMAKAIMKEFETTENEQPDGYYV